MKNIILASKSPRRIEMLSRYFPDIKLYDPNIYENMEKDELPQTKVMKIAFEKANYVNNQIQEQGIIVAADTIVYLDKIMGKPKDRNEAYEMLQFLSGKTHSVFTGICLIDNTNNKKIVDYEETKVSFNKLEDSLIKKYLGTGEYKDKAGAYGIQGYGELLVNRIEGCYSNVVGLPISKLNKLMIEHFFFSIL